MASRILNPKFLPLPNTTFNRDCLQFAFDGIKDKTYTNKALEDQTRLSSLSNEERTQNISRIIALAFKSIQQIISEGDSVIVPSMGHFKYNPNTAIKIEGYRKALDKRGYLRIKDIADKEERRKVSEEISEYRKEECTANNLKRSIGVRIVESSLKPSTTPSYVAKLKFQD